MSLRDLLAFFGATRHKPNYGAPVVRVSPEPQGVQRLPVPVMAGNGVYVRGYYERHCDDHPEPDLRPRHIITHLGTWDDEWGVKMDEYIQTTEVTIRGYQPEDKVNAYLQFLADWGRA